MIDFLLFVFSGGSCSGDGWVIGFFFFFFGCFVVGLLVVVVWWVWCNDRWFCGGIWYGFVGFAW